MQIIHVDKERNSLATFLLGNYYIVLVTNINIPLQTRVGSSNY